MRQSSVPVVRPRRSLTNQMRFAMSVITAAVFAGTLAATAIARQAATPDSRIDAVFAKYSRTTPGCSLGVSRKGAIVLETGYGMADLEHDVAIRPDTIFEAGSVSKQFTAAAILLLAREGKLSLDDPARKYVPELPDYGAPLTIRHMLTHTSGLRDWGNVASIAGWPRGTRVHTHAQVLDIISRQRSLNFPSGTRYSYCNTGYNLAAIIVERVSGQPFTEFTRTRIFEPLGMTRTSWRDDYTRIVKDRSIAYAESMSGFSMEMPFENVYGQGGLLTTVGDLLRWAGNLSQPKVGDPAFVKEEQEPGRFNDGRQHGYALGLMIGTYQGMREVSHSGATAAYRAYLSSYPDRQLAVAVLCNVGTGNATQFAHAVADVYLGAPPAGTSVSTNGSTRVAPSDALAGLYRRAGTGEPMSVVRAGDELKIEPGPRLTANSGTRFTSPNGSRYEFGANALRVTDTFGTVDEYALVQGEELKTRSLADYAGTYDSDEAETTLVAAVENGALVLKRRPDSVIRLTPVYADAFQSSLGFIRFRRSLGGQIVGLSVTQDRVWEMMFAKRGDSR